MGGLIGGGVGIMGLVMSIIGGIIGLFIGGAIVLVISAICGGSTSFEANVRVTASLMALSPVSAILGFLSGISLWLGGLVSLAVSLYGLYLLYIAITKALGGKEGTAKVISIILAAIPVLMLLSTLLCAKAATDFSDQMMKNMPAENQKQFNKLAEDFNKALQEEAKKLNKEGE
ncbi:MAG TPA: YIP1 family protein [Spirochaetota bacterium]|nr:YIP1 family protein [Spirochaetota bacterium]